MYENFQEECAKQLCWGIPPLFFLLIPRISCIRDIAIAWMVGIPDDKESERPVSGLTFPFCQHHFLGWNPSAQRLGNCR